LFRCVARRVMLIAQGPAARVPHAHPPSRSPVRACVRACVHVFARWVFCLWVQDLSRLMFNRHGGNPREIKANILDFNGFAFPDAKAEVSGFREREGGREPLSTALARAAQRGARTHSRYASVLPGEHAEPHQQEARQGSQGNHELPGPRAHWLPKGYLNPKT